MSFKVVVGSVILLQYLVKEIPFKVSMSSMNLLYYLAKGKFHGNLGIYDSVASS